MISKKNLLTFTTCFELALVIGNFGTLKTVFAGNVFGSDDRNPVYFPKLQKGQNPDIATLGGMAYVGLLTSPKKSDGFAGLCTATLVGKRTVLTAAHCVTDPDRGGIVFGQFKFQLEFNDGNSAFTAYSNNIYISKKYQPSDTKLSSNENDFAFIQLSDAPPFAGFAKIEAQNISDRSHLPLLADVGYSGDFPRKSAGKIAGIDSKCAMRGVLVDDKDVFTMDCDLNKGASGGPVFLWNSAGAPTTVIGINVAEQCSDMKTNPNCHYADYAGVLNANYGLSVARFQAELQTFLNKYDK